VAEGALELLPGFYVELVDPKRILVGSPIVFPVWRQRRISWRRSSPRFR